MTDKKPSHSPISDGRRQLLIGSGLLGAAAAISPAMAFAHRRRWDRTTPADTTAPVDWTVDQLRAALDKLRDDTFFGMAAFAVPGNDPYSEYQGVSTAYPGGITTRADLYLAGGVNLLLPMPSGFMKQLLASIASFLSDSPMDIPEMAAGDLGENGEWILENLDSSFTDYLEGEVSGTVLLTVLLNLVATRVGGSIQGPFPSPFANLSWDQKARVFQELENPRSWLKRGIGWNIPDRNFREATPGVLNTLIGFILRIGGFSAYNEFAVFNPATREVVQRPLGWVLSQYAPDAPPSGIGSDDLIGYYQGRRSV